jgi:hypothetical protein
VDWGFPREHFGYSIEEKTCVISPCLQGQLGGNQTDTVLSMLAKISPYVGLRPCGWLHATIVGQNLNVLNAKCGNGRALGQMRVIGLSWLPLKIITLVSHLIRQVRLLFAEVGSNWRKILGRLRGAAGASLCTIGIRRWSLYTTRHVAIANWKRASLSDAEIAALAGHSSTRTARQHCAGGRLGWSAKFACARPRSPPGGGDCGAQWDHGSRVGR